MVVLEVLALPCDQFVASLYRALIDMLVWVVYNRALVFCLSCLLRFHKDGMLDCSISAALPLWCF